MKNYILFIFLLFSSPLFAQQMEVVKLTCDSRNVPLGVEAAQPMLGWQIKTTQQAVMQTAYRIIVADNLKDIENNTGSVWDSKKVMSGNSIRVVYAGKSLQPAKTYYWKVQVWTNKNRQAWSRPASWQMGLLSNADWKGAKWIAYESMPDSVLTVPAEHGKGDARLQNVKNTLPLLRKTIIVQKTLRKATAFICGLGQFELSLNGEKKGDHFLDPGWTQYDKEAQYVVFDLTNELKTGKNALGVMLGNGFYFIPRQRYRKLTGAFGFPKLIMRLLIEYADGATENIVSDESWKAAPSPITFSSIYGGEDYNATMEQRGWNTSSFNDAGWKNAIIVDGPSTLYAQLVPMKVRSIFRPIDTTNINISMHVFDLGQNASGIPQITVRGKKGDTVRIVPAELLKEDGTATQRATGSPVYFDYILKGDGIETWQPRFSYYGFRYLQVERAALANNTAGLPVLIKINGLHTSSDVQRSGSFHSSEELFNKIYSLVDWSVKSNMASVLTDCPHREKLGWLEQTHLMGNSIRYNYDMAAYFRKTVRDMKAAQNTNGVVPEFAPEFVKMPFMDSIFMDSPEWGSACIILPWYLYKWYGDAQTIADSYDMMKQYLAHLQSRSKDNIIAYGLGDWYDLGPNKPGLAQLTPMGITATAIYYYDLQLMSKMALLLNNAQDAKAYTALAAQVRAAFNNKFFDKTTMQYGSGSQTANAMAVELELVEPQYKQAVIENIVKDVRSRNNSLTAGDVGYRYLLKTLDAAGRSDVIFDMNSRTDVPGYGFQLVKGATALTESWQALPSVSNNHLMLGHLMEWFYEGLAGISQPENSVAFKQILIRPQPVGNVTNVKSSYESQYGLIRSEWTNKNNLFELEVEIPANTTAFIELPGMRTEQVGSGIYRFKVKKVSQEKMQQVYNEVKTPYKYGLVMAPPNDSMKMDCPSIFRKGNDWYMVYILYGGRGYETWLAKSKDLLNWQTLGKLLSFSNDTTQWDANQKAGYIALQDMNWSGSYELNKYNGKYWMSYFGGSATGYEAGLLSLGMAYTDKDPAQPHEWKRLAKPIMMSTDADVRWWENRKQFKSTVIWDKQQLTGHPFVMYYNANGDSAKNNVKTRWFERIGMAVSDDMMNWKRFHAGPVVHHPVGITGDPVIQKIGDVYVMFYFGAFWEDRKGAFNRFACSYDLVNWTDWTGDNLVQSSEPYDERYAHKSFVVKHNGVVYHFYCAVNKKEQRGIAVATSKDMGTSKVQFVSN